MGEKVDDAEVAEPFLQASQPDGYGPRKELALFPILRAVRYILLGAILISLAFAVVRILIALGQSFYAVHSFFDFSIKGVVGPLIQAAVIFSVRVSELSWILVKLIGILPQWATFILILGLAAGCIALVILCIIAIPKLIGFAGAGTLIIGGGFSSAFAERIAAWLSHPLHRGRAMACRLVGLALYGICAHFVIGHIALSTSMFMPPATFSALYSILGFLVLSLWLLPVGFLIVLAALDIRALWRLLHSREYPLSEWKAEAKSHGVTVRVAHMSDLHLGTHDLAPRTEEGVAGNVQFRELLKTHRLELARCDAIVITGDITDTGHAEEWARFFEIVDPALLETIVLLPGNHDLNIVDARDRLAVEPLDNLGRACRQLRMLAAMDTVQGRRAKVLVDGEWMSLRSYLQRHKTALLAFYQGKTRDAAFVEKIWNNAFPMTVPIGEHFSIHIIDSNDVSSTIVTNAFGRVQQHIFVKLRELTRRDAGRSTLLGLHHHLAFHPSIHEHGTLERLKTRFMVLQNARELLAALDDRPTVIMHGHRHLPYQGRIGNGFDLVSAPSTTLGDVRGTHGAGFQILWVARTEDGGSRVVRADWRGTEPHVSVE